jgi:flagellar hook-associated protein 3 FlgL
MRITQKMMTNKVNSNLSKNAEKLMKSQSQISSGKRITLASDDPVGMAKALDYRKALDSADQYVRNISQARSGLEAGESTLSDIGELLNRAKELALSQATGTASPETRKSVAEEVRQIRDQLIQLANSKQGDRYMFGGRRTDAPPYNPNVPPYDPLDPEPKFQGDNGGFSVMVADGVVMDIAVSGQQAFDSAVDPVVVLSRLIQGLEDNDPTAISGQLDTLDQSLDQITNERADAGARLNRLDVTESHWETFKINMQQMLSDTEDVDLTQAITDLTAQQSAFQASLASASKIIQQPSLLDYLR